MKRIFIHMGPVKTGSTSIQETFWNNSEILAQNDVAYVGGNECDFALTSAFYKDPLKYSANVALELTKSQIEKRDQERLSEIGELINTSNAEIILLSSEHLPFLNVAELDTLKKHFEQYGTVSIIYYIREIIDWISSDTQQMARNGLATRSTSFATACDVIDNFPRNLVSIFGRENVHFVSFSEAIRFGLCDSILKILGVPTVKKLGIEEVRTNESLSESAARAFFVYNKVCPSIVPFRDKNLVDKIANLPGKKYNISGLSEKEILDYQIRRDRVETLTGVSLAPDSELAVAKSPDQFAEVINEIFDREDYQVGRNYRLIDLFSRERVRKRCKRAKEIALRRERLSRDDIVVFAIGGLLAHYIYLLAAST